MEQEMILTMETGTKLVKEAEQYLVQYKDLVIKNNEDYISTGDDLKKIKAKVSELNDERKSYTKPLDDKKAWIMDIFRKPLEILAQSEACIKKAILVFQQEEEKKRRVEQERLDKIAREEEERQRAILQKQIDEAKKKKDTDKLAELKEKKAEIFVPAPILASTVPETKGISTKTIWRYKIINQNIVPREYLIIDEKKLQEVATSSKGTIKVAGIKFYSDEIISARK